MSHRAGTTRAPEPRRPPRRVPTPRPGGGVRWLVELDEADARTYRAAVAGLVPAIERGLGAAVLANRALGRGGRPTTELEPWGPARACYRAAVRRALASSRQPTVVVADVSACYRSIGCDAVASALRALGAPADATGRVVGFLRGLRDAGIEGLPVGPEPSAILANAVLAAADDAIGAAGAVHLRWVDDLAIFARSPRTAAGALEAVRRALARADLELHDAKTRVIADPDEVHDVLLRSRRSVATGHPMA